MTTSILHGHRIAFLAGTLQQGGAERQLFRMVACLQERGVPVCVLCLTEGDHWEGPMRAAHIPVVHVGDARSRLHRLQRIIGALREFRATVVQSQHFYANTYAAVAAMRLGITGIGAIRNDGRAEVEANGFPMGWLHMYLPRRIVANSRVGIDFAVARGRAPARVMYLPNAVDDAFLEPYTREPHEGIRLLGVGRLTRQKRFDLFLDVAAAVEREMPGVVRGTIVGDRRPGDSTAEDLYALAQRVLPSSDLVTFAGPTNDVRAAYRQADILLLCSDHEGTPNVVLEAMACGLPVIATRVGAIDEIIQDGKNGFIVPRGDTAAMLRVLRMLASDPAQRVVIGAAARETIQRTFDTRTMSGNLERLYAWSAGDVSRRAGQAVHIMNGTA